MCVCVCVHARVLSCAYIVAVPSLTANHEPGQEGNFTDFTGYPPRARFHARHLLYAVGFVPTVLRTRCF